MWRSIGLAAVLVLPPALLFSANLDAAGYMDEVFHMPQAQALCKGDFASWNPKITTLPGLYYASLVLLPAANIIARVAQAFLNLGGIMTPVLPEGDVDAGVLLLDRRLSLACSGRELRLVNALLAVLLAATFHRILEHLHGPQGETGRLPHRLRVAVLVLFPVQFFFYFLFYTDTVGSLMVLAMYERTILAVCLANVGPGVWRQAHVLYSAAACGAAAVLCRQTNVVWVVFCGGTFVINRIENAFPLPTATALTVRVSHLIRHLMSQKGLDLAREVGPLVFVVFGFIVFVVLNGGVAVGDKSNHQAGFHPLQPCYWLLLLLFLLMPWTVSLARLRAFLQLFRDRYLLMHSSLLLMVASIHVFTYAHPFLLADNRHYTFYLWRRVISRLRYLMAPVYVFGGWSSWHALCHARGRSCLWVAWFYFCACLVVVPTGLLEFRYYLPQTLLFLLHQPLGAWRGEARRVQINMKRDTGDDLSPWFNADIAALLLYIIINAGTIYVFLFRPFLWPDGSVARFMW